MPATRLLPPAEHGLHLGSCFNLRQRRAPHAKRVVLRQQRHPLPLPAERCSLRHQWRLLLRPGISTRRSSHSTPSSGSKQRLQPRGTQVACIGVGACTTRRMPSVAPLATALEASSHGDLQAPCSSVSHGGRSIHRRRRSRRCFRRRRCCRCRLCAPPEELGQAACTSCPAGSITNTGTSPGATTCTGCDKGKYSTKSKPKFTTGMRW